MCKVRPFVTAIKRADFRELELRRAVDIFSRSRPRSLAQERAGIMVVANKNLLKEVRKLAIRDELLAMRLRSRLVVAPAVEKPAAKPDARG